MSETLYDKIHHNTIKAFYLQSDILYQFDIFRAERFHIVVQGNVENLKKDHRE